MWRTFSLLCLTSCVSFTLRSDDELLRVTQVALSCSGDNLKIGKKGFDKNGTLLWEASCGLETFICGQERRGPQVSVRCVPTNTLVRYDSKHNEISEI